jgi:hypothetical protein
MTPNHVSRAPSERTTRVLGEIRVGRPDWAPLENAIPYEWCGGFMFMGYVDDIRLYKHIHTRHYLNLDSTGRTYRYRGGGYVRTSFEAAIEHVFEGLAELGLNRSGDRVTRNSHDHA